MWRERSSGGQELRERRGTEDKSGEVGEHSVGSEKERVGWWARIERKKQNSG